MILKVIHQNPLYYIISNFLTVFKYDKIFNIANKSIVVHAKGRSTAVAELHKLDEQVQAPPLS